MSTWRRNAPDAVAEAMDRAVGDEASGFSKARRSARARAERVVIGQGDVWWADLPEPRGSAPGFRRPVVVVQGDALNRSRVGTAVCVPLTSNLKWAVAPGNVLLTSRATGLPKDSVANVSQIVALDKGALTERVGKLARAKAELILSGIDVVLGR